MVAGAHVALLDLCATGFARRAAGVEAGPIAVGSYAALRCADIAVHAWDLARATGQDDALDGRVVERALVPYVRWAQGIGASDRFAAPAAAHDGDSRQGALLRPLGRGPQWPP